ncbi:MAG TPA: penicillin-binding transpeptidase domain-containing protein [Vicinamibacterales bacterium]|nr:penicillin-binding transpeptidase domain-containing protein [Vicinamibacterales bacterium]
MNFSRLGAACLLATAALGSLARAATETHQCALIQTLDGSAPFVSDAAECVVKTAPASTFKVPHALIALETGVVADPLALVPWDGTKYPFPAWEKPHSLDSAMKSSALWFYQRTARLIGRERMLASLKRLGYGTDSYEGEQTTFWLTGDLAVSPLEQLDFVSRVVTYRLPAERRNIDAVKAAFVMPQGAITNASGTHPFALTWPGPLVVHAKTGNTTVAREGISWIVGYVEANARLTAFAARVRGGELSMQAGADLALRTLNAHRPR